MILSLTYNFFYNKNDNDILSMTISNLKLYSISVTFYLIIYTLILYFNNPLIKKLFYIIFIFDIFYLVINIISTVLPSEYSIIKSIKKKLNLYKENEINEDAEKENITKEDIVKKDVVKENVVKKDVQKGDGVVKEGKGDGVVQEGKGEEITNVMK